MQIKLNLGIFKLFCLLLLLTSCGSHSNHSDATNQGSDGHGSGSASGSGSGSSDPSTTILNFSLTDGTNQSRIITSLSNKDINTIIMPSSSDSTKKLNIKLTLPENATITIQDTDIDPRTVTYNYYASDVTYVVTAADHHKSDKYTLHTFVYTDPFINNKNIKIFTDDMPTREIQSSVDNTYLNEMENQFSPDRIALLFMPGKYGLNTSPLDIKVGYYTSVIGLGKSPDDINITGTVRAELGSDGNGTDNFWRSMENISIVPTITKNKQSTIPCAYPSPTTCGTTFDNHNAWVVSQAAPIRRVHILGALDLSVNVPSTSTKGGWTSGGFMANSIIDGEVDSGTQQQWFTRNSNFTNWARAIGLQFCLELKVTVLT